MCTALPRLCKREWHSAKPAVRQRQAKGADKGGWELAVPAGSITRQLNAIHILPLLVRDAVYDDVHRSPHISEPVNGDHACRTPMPGGHLQYMVNDQKGWQAQVTLIYREASIQYSHACHGAQRNIHIRLALRAAPLKHELHLNMWGLQRWR